MKTCEICHINVTGIVNIYNPSLPDSRESGFYCSKVSVGNKTRYSYVHTVQSQTHLDTITTIKCQFSEGMGIGEAHTQLLHINNEPGS